jgi:hypothetical protein
VSTRDHKELQEAARAARAMRAGRAVGDHEGLSESLGGHKETQGAKWGCRGQLVAAWGHEELQSPERAKEVLRRPWRFMEDRKGPRAEVPTHVPMALWWRFRGLKKQYRISNADKRREKKYRSLASCV